MNVTNIKNNDHKRRKFLSDEKVDYICVSTELDYYFCCSNYGYCLFPLFSKLLYIFKFLYISPHDFQKLL